MCGDVRTLPASVFTLNDFPVMRVLHQQSLLSIQNSIKSKDEAVTGDLRHSEFTDIKKDT